MSNPVSLPYIEMTLQVMQQFGITAQMIVRLYWIISSFQWIDLSSGRTRIGYREGYTRTRPFTR